MPLSEDLDNLRRMEDAGAAAVVFHSMFEEQIRHEDETLHRHFTLSKAAAWPACTTYNHTRARRHLNLRD